MIRQFFIGMLVVGSSAVFSQPTPQEMNEFKRLAEINQLTASRERMIDSVSTETCRPIVDVEGQPAHYYWTCLGSARGVVKNMISRDLEVGNLLPPLKDQPEFIEQQLFILCKRSLEKPFMRDDYTFCKRGIEGAIKIVAMASEPKKSKSKK